MNFSLRHLLLVTLLSATMLIWGVTAFFSYKLTRDEVVKLFDAELVQSGKVLLTFVENLLKDGSLPEFFRNEKDDKFSYSYPLDGKIDNKLAIQMWSEENGLLLHPNNALEFPVHYFSETVENDNKQLWRLFDEFLQVNTLSQKYERKIAFQLCSSKAGLLLRSGSAPKVPFSAVLRGFSNANIDGEVWQVYSIANSTGEYVIHVAQREEIRTELSDEISEQLLTQFLVGLPFLGAVIWFIVGIAVKPITRLEKSLSKREASFLKPLALKGLPSEIVPVVKEINNLFAQLEEAFENERRFTADASHELRTPLAGLLTQVQVALKTEDEGVRKQALQRIEQAVNRMTYMVQQLLTFSRIESGVEYVEKEPMNLGNEIVQVLADIEREAHKKNIQLEFIEENVPPITANIQLIHVLIRNIVDNAIKYTPPNGVISIYLNLNGKEVELCVEDSGPGISPEQYEKSLKRFYRCIETSNTVQGTGLGFSIVKRIAESHGAQISLGVSRYEGLKVKIMFPLPKRTADKKLSTKLRLFKAAKTG